MGNRRNSYNHNIISSSIHLWVFYSSINWCLGPVTSSEAIVLLITISLLPMWHRRGPQWALDVSVRPNWTWPRFGTRVHADRLPYSKALILYKANCFHRPATTIIIIITSIITSRYLCTKIHCECHIWMINSQITVTTIKCLCGQAVESYSSRMQWLAYNKICNKRSSSNNCLRSLSTRLGKKSCWGSGPRMRRKKMRKRRRFKSFKKRIGICSCRSDSLSFQSMPLMRLLRPI